VAVNWCPELGTVLANEEVIDGKSERGGHPVVRMPLTQWMLRITSYAERLIEDLEDVDWPRPIKDMQRNWVGRSEGAEVDFFIGRDPAEMNRWLSNESSNRPGYAFTPGNDGSAWASQRNEKGWPASASTDVIRVYTTRPDTLFGATYMVLAPEHPLVDRLTTPEQREAVAAYRAKASAKSDLDRTDLAKTKTGVFTGAYALNPAGSIIPVWIADYVLMGYGTGAIMAVPGHDERDFEFAKAFNLPVLRVVAPGLEQADLPLDHAEPEPAVSVNSRNDGLTLDGLPTPEAKVAITAWLEKQGLGKKTINYKLRDWLFSRQRYWGEPFPVVLDKDDRTLAIAESELPVHLPELEDFKPTGKPEPPLSKAKDWVQYSEKYRRETNTMPQWAGSCWYYLRYIDPHNDKLPWDPEKEKYWLPVDLYVGGAEHAVLHLLYSRFWHKVLFDRGLVSTAEPFQKLINQGMILGETEYTAFRDTEGRWARPEDSERDGISAVKLSEDQVVKKGEGFVLAADPSVKVDARAHKMSKSRGNVINPNPIVAEYGADSLRLYEMFMGPLEAVKPWSMNGVEGVYRFLGRAWRMIVDAEADVVHLDPRVKPVDLTPEQVKIVARTIAAVTDDLDGYRFNTAISRLMEFVNFFTSQEVRPARAMETFALLLAPMAPHMAEELWSLLGHEKTLAFEPWPEFDPALLKDDEVEIPVQINGKLRGKVVVAAEADNAVIQKTAVEDPKIAQLLEGKTVRKVVVVPGKLVNFVVS
jgi:leucyl-tRNA synthetase